MVVVEVPYKDEIRVSAPPEEAYALVADVYRSGMHFPAVTSLIPVDEDGRWRWTMGEKGFGPVKFRAAYDAVYVCDATARTVRWNPPSDGAGDMESSGSWAIVADGPGTRLIFDSLTVAHIPGPRLMAKMIDAFAKEELSRLKRQYVAAIAKTLNSKG